MVETESDPFASLEEPEKPAPFALGFDKSSGDALVYGAILLGVILAAVGLFSGQYLIMAGALFPLAIAFWHYPMIDRGVPQIGANNDGLFVERLGFVDWGAISGIELVRTSVRTIRLARLKVSLTRPLEDAIVKPERFPIWKRFMMRNWSSRRREDGTDVLTIELHPLTNDPDTVLARLIAFRPSAKRT